MRESWRSRHLGITAGGAVPRRRLTLLNDFHRVVQASAEGAKSNQPSRDSGQRQPMALPFMGWVGWSRSPPASPARSGGCATGARPGWAAPRSTARWPKPF